MKKVLILLAALLVVSISANTMFAETDVEGIAVVINYNDDDDIYVVEISDSDIISEKTPTMEVETNFNKAKVYFDDGVHELKFIDSTTNNSIVRFIVEKGGKYFVENDPGSPSSKPKYIAPKTGVN